MTAGQNITPLVERVAEMERVRNKDNADVVVRRTYTCSSCKWYHKTIVSTEFRKDIDKWFPLVLLHYYYDSKPTRIKVEKHGNRTSSNMPYLRTKVSTKQSIAEHVGQYGPKRALFQVTKEAGGVCGVDSTGTLTPVMRIKSSTLRRNCKSQVQLARTHLHLCCNYRKPDFMVLYMKSFVMTSQ